MEFLNPISQFHFLRPAWLLLLIPAAWLLWSVYRRNDSLRAWRKVIAPHLLELLVVQKSGKQGRWRPVYMLGLAWAVGIIALSGPSWKLQDSPFSEDQAALFIILKVSPEMLSEDIQPSRLQRSILKIHDLLELKSDIKSGLIAYAGSAHLVMPLTSDRRIINSFAAALEPGIMPLQGDAVSEAIMLANKRLEKVNTPGSIVLITDAIDRAELASLEKIKQQGSADVHILAVAAGTDVIPPAGSPPAPALDIDLLEDASRAIGGSLSVVSADKSDITKLASNITSSIKSAPTQEGQQWQDAGYYLLFLLLPISLMFFRRGGSVSVE